MSFCHLNIRSAVKNLNEFSVYLDNLKHNFSVIGISETWFQEANYNLYTIEDYTGWLKNTGKINAEEE